VRGQPLTRSRERWVIHSRREKEKNPREALLVGECKGERGNSDETGLTGKQDRENGGVIGKVL